MEIWAHRSTWGGALLSQHQARPAPIGITNQRRNHGGLGYMQQSADPQHNVVVPAPGAAVCAAAQTRWKETTSAEPPGTVRRSVLLQDQLKWILVAIEGARRNATLLLAPSTPWLNPFTEQDPRLFAMPAVKTLFQYPQRISDAPRVSAFPRSVLPEVRNSRRSAAQR